MLEHSRSLIVSGCCNRSYKLCQHHLSPCFNQHVISFEYLCDDEFTSAETNSLNKHSYMNHIFIFMSVFLSAYFIPIRYITPPDLILKSKPCFKQHVISFWRYLCDDTVTSAETNIFNNIYMRITLNTWAFIFMSVFLSSCFLPICRIILPCLILKAFIYTIVCSYTCRLYWDHVLQLPYWKFAALLCLTLLWRLFACRRRSSCTISCIFESLYIREHSYTCLSFWLHALYRFVLPSPCFSFIHCITLPHSMFNASHFEIPLLRWFACWKQQSQKIITAAFTYKVDMLLVTTSATHVISWKCA